MNILLIEPDAKLARTYQQALKRAGHSVRVAAHAQGAIDRADDSIPDLVILELQLVAHNGFEFLHEFRSYPEWQHVPVLLLTNVVSASLETASLASLGVVGYLYKPATSLQKLVTTIEALP